MKIEFITGYDDQVVPGNERDKDVYARMCGIENGVCVLKITINEHQENQLILELCSIGDQRIELPDNEADPLYEAIENANKFELFEESERLLILKALNNQELNFGKITHGLKQKSIIRPLKMNMNQV